jgi:small subunit ribosomal protein S4
MADTKCKTCRRASEKLFLKGERCFTPKCAIVRKPYPPGNRRKKFRRTESEFATQLHEKQKLRNLYLLREEQFSNYVYDAMKSTKGDTETRLLVSLSRRLDNVVFEAGFAPSRSVARQLVSHGHVFVNGKKAGIPSYSVKTGDAITLKEKIKSSLLLANLETTMKKYNPPAWISLDKATWTAKISGIPEVKERTPLYNTKLIIEYYAR